VWQYLTFNMEVLIKFGITAVLGLMIGLERELKRKPVGLKTCLVISIVSCLLTIVSYEAAYIAPRSELGVAVTMDPLRLAAQIVSGIGFLGAGVILKRGNDSISGLTTAAIIWGAAGIGIAVGVGFYFEAITGALFILISVQLTPLVMKFIGPKQLRDQEVTLRIVVSENKYLDEIINEIRNDHFSIYRLSIRNNNEGGYQINLQIGIHYKQSVTSLYNFTNSMDGVVKVELESAA
jgi:putative Mg2+ transporter-C (MgtC) family protein